MKNVVLLLCMMCVVLTLNAQDFTRSFSSTVKGTQGARMAVLPFEPRMIISDLHRDMCVKNGMNSKQVREALAGGFCYAMRETAPRMMEAEVFGWDDPWPAALESLYKEMGYKNTPLRHDVDHSSRGAYLDQGELRYHYDTLTRFMQPVISGEVLRKLADETGTDFILMVSQLDIVNLGELVRVNPGKTDFYVRLHYALYNPLGELVDGGLVSHSLETQTYDPADIARNEFKKVTARLYDSVSPFIFDDDDQEQIEPPAPKTRTQNEN